VHLAGFAPAFTLSLCDSEYARKPPVPIASVVTAKCKKKKKRQLCYIKTEERNEEINPHSGTFGFSRRKNQRNEKPKEPSFFHAPMPTHHPLGVG